MLHLWQSLNRGLKTINLCPHYFLTLETLRWRRYTIYRSSRAQCWRCSPCTRILDLEAITSWRDDNFQAILFPSRWNLVYYWVFTRSWHVMRYEFVTWYLSPYKTGVCFHVSLILLLFLFAYLDERSERGMRDGERGLFSICYFRYYAFAFAVFSRMNGDSRFVVKDDYIKQELHNHNWYCNCRDVIGATWLPRAFFAGSKSDISGGL